MKEKTLTKERKELFEEELFKLRNDGLQLATIKKIELMQIKVEKQDKQFIEEVLEEIITPQLFHEIYEKQARRSGWETHKDCKLKSFDELPETNQETMIYTIEEIKNRIKQKAGFEE